MILTTEPSTGMILAMVTNHTFGSTGMILQVGEGQWTKKGVKTLENLRWIPKMMLASGDGFLRLQKMAVIFGILNFEGVEDHPSGCKWLMTMVGKSPK